MGQHVAVGVAVEVVVREDGDATDAVGAAPRRGRRRRGDEELASGSEPDLPRCADVGEVVRAEADGQVQPRQAGQTVRAARDDLRPLLGEDDGAREGAERAGRRRCVQIRRQGEGLTVVVQFFLGTEILAIATTSAASRRPA